MAQTSKTAASKTTKTEPEEMPDAEPAPEPVRVESDCVVESNFHVGRAVNGRVCSYHAMHYKADGTAR